MPLRITNYKQSNVYPDKIILHHSECILSDKKIEYDSSKFQTGYFSNKLVQINKKESGINFLIEKINNDYQVIVMQPLLTKCFYSDLNENYSNCVHIALMGNYDIDIPTNRLYEVLAYKLIVPLLRLFYLETKDVIFHGAISDTNITCPGSFVDMTKIKSQIERFFKRQNVRRR